MTTNGDSPFGIPRESIDSSEDDSFKEPQSLHLFQCMMKPGQVHRLVYDLAVRIRHDYTVGVQGTMAPIVVVLIMKGAFMFGADLVRHLGFPIQVEFMSVAPPGEMPVVSGPQFQIQGRDILVVDDFIDTGATMFSFLEYLQFYKPNSLKSCVLLSKLEATERPVTVDYVGCAIPQDWSTIGYGADFNQTMRHLSGIWRLYCAKHG